LRRAVCDFQQRKAVAERSQSAAAEQQYRFVPNRKIMKVFTLPYAVLFFAVIKLWILLGNPRQKA
jgi:hypothetical protein